MVLLQVTLVALTLAQPQEAAPLRNDSIPMEWKKDDIAKELPGSKEKEPFHIVAWETTKVFCKEDCSTYDRSQILVLKKSGEGRYFLTNLYYDPKGKDGPWHRQMVHSTDFDQKGMPVSNWFFGYKGYDRIPTDKEIEDFLKECDWDPGLGDWQASQLGDKGIEHRNYRTTLAAGGVDGTIWKQQLGREAPANLFPELKVPDAKKK
jgi:hypothetical protein